MVHKIGKLLGKHRRSVTLWSNAGALLMVILLLGTCQGRVTLEVEGAGTGRVISDASNPAHFSIDCTITNGIETGMCIDLMDDEATLKAIPGAGFTTITWTGCKTVRGANSQICDVTKSQEIFDTVEVSVTFGAEFTLSVTVEGNEPGTVVSDIGGINCASPNTCSAAFAPGTDVTLTASPSAFFTSWSGPNCPVAGSTNPVETVTMNADVACDANLN